MASENEDDDQVVDEDETATPEEVAYAYVDLESQARLWLRTILPVLQLRSHDSDPSPRVQLAFDLMHIAACERVSRILRSDVPTD